MLFPQLPLHAQLFRDELLSESILGPLQERVVRIHPGNAAILRLAPSRDIVFISIHCNYNLRPQALVPA